MKMSSIAKTMVLVVAPFLNIGIAWAADGVLSYPECLALVEKNPNQAFEESEAWFKRNKGGLEARHCSAQALLALGIAKPAALRLEEIAAEYIDKDKEKAAAMLAQSAHVWVIANDPARAGLRLEQAIKQTPNDPDLLVDRGELLAQQNQHTQALSYFDRALAINASHTFALTFKAASLRLLERPSEALPFAQKATQISPFSASAWLELGNTEAQLDHLAQARVAWGKVIEIAPNTPAAHAASRNLQNVK